MTLFRYDIIVNVRLSPKQLEPLSMKPISKYASSRLVEYKRAE